MKMTPPEEQTPTVVRKPKLSVDDIVRAAYEKIAPDKSTRKAMKLCFDGTGGCPGFEHRDTTV